MLIHGQDRFMPRRELLTAAQREALLTFPQEEENQLQYYTLSVRDLAIVHQHRGDHNRLGFAVQLCYLRYRAGFLQRMKRRQQHCSALSRHSCRLNRLYGTSTRVGMKRAVNI
jgi:hypothetical protein